ARPRLGVLCGLRSEVHCMGRWVAHSAVSIEVSGATNNGAKRGAAALIDGGAKVLLSWGLCGGLSKELRSGDFVQPERLALPGAGNTEYIDLDELTLPRARHGVLAGSEAILTAPSQKAAVAEQTGALAVDMESIPLALAGINAGLPVFVVRAVADNVELQLPDLAIGALDDRGRIRPWRAVRALMADPTQIGAAIRAGRAARRGLRSLRSVADDVFGSLLADEPDFKTACGQRRR
ncbi:MAG: hypothetical protein AAF439_11085, partial [Pseudomonadota bacterium]